ncbi:nucleoside phosphatase GDA1/CD39, partial [Tribonema minus]
MAPRRPLPAAPGVLQRLLLAASCLAAAVSAKSSLLDTSAVAHGMIIDAGSGGSRLHVFRWGSRQFDSAPPPISYPFSNNDWCNRLRPGISSYADHPQDVGQSLKPLVDFAKTILKDHEEDWHKYPIYLRATAGMRQLEPTKRVAVLDAIRDYLGGPECPFHFEYHYVRVLAGEEEGVYGWAAVNFLRGDLLPSSDGAGTAASASTVGALDMGGASTQISFFRPDQDIMSNLFKLQIGSQKHWNVYTHSFLGFGEAAMRMR